MYVEGYLYGGPAHEPGRRTGHRRSPEAAGTDVALSLSDPYWVELHGAELASLLDRVDRALRQRAGGLRDRRVRRTWTGPWRPWPAAVRRSP